MVATATVRALQRKLIEQEISVSVGTILSLTPFYITYATDKELSLCLCKLCLNSRMLYNVLQIRAKKDVENAPESMTDFLKSLSNCFKSVNGGVFLKNAKTANKHNRFISATNTQKKQQRLVSLRSRKQHI